MRNYKKKFWNRQSIATMLLCLFSAGTVLAADSLSVQEMRIRERVQYLSSDELQGRASGSEGNRKAAQYISDFFRQHKLQPVNGSSYTQEFPVPTAVKIGPNNKLSFDILVIPEGLSKAQGRKMSVPWKAGQEYTPLSFTEDSTITGAHLVFAGFGITAKEANYDDYAGIDVKGKVVIVLRGTPEQNDGNKKFSEKNVADPHSKFANFAGIRDKAINAREHGAAGILFVSPQGDSADVLLPLHIEESGGRHSGIVAVQVKRSAVTKIFTKQRSIFGAEEKILSTHKPQSFELEDMTINLTTQLEIIEQPTANVIGLVPGTDPALANEYIIVGAHFDHLGMGDSHSLYTGKEPAIHHGADDNASGTAGMMEIAADIADHPLPRPVLFMGYSGEEMGLLGSAYYTSHPLIPLEKTVFMLNMDMIGRLKDNALMVEGVGTSSRWKSLTDSLGTAFTFKISTTQDGFGNSDHSSFYARNIPIIFIFTGTHSDYHRPSDTWDKINYPGEYRVVQFAEALLRNVAAYPQKPDFIKVKDDAPKSSMRFNAYLGTIPDYSDNPKGLRISGTHEGGPADKAGMREGDIIVKFDGMTVKNIYDYTTALSNHKPGDRVKIVVLRGEKDQQVTLDVTLAKRGE